MIPIRIFLCLKFWYRFTVKMKKKFGAMILLICLFCLLSFIYIVSNSKEVIVFDGPEILAVTKGPGQVIIKKKYNWSETIQYAKPSPSHRKLDFIYNCSKLFNGDVTEIARVRGYLQARNYLFATRSSSEIRQMASDCSSFRRQYMSHYISSTEKEFPIAFNILFHTNLDQLERLLRAIYRPHNTYCIHVDSKVPEEIMRSVRSITNCFNNVFVASSLEFVVYADFSRLMADINCMRDHVNNGGSWKYLINMAATEFPIMTNLQLVQILQLYNGFNDVRAQLTTGNEYRYKKKYVTKIDVVAKSGYIEVTKDLKEPPPFGLTITKGNAYNVLSRQFVEFFLTDEKAIAFLAWSSDTLTPDEHYWATLNNLYSNPFLNTPGGMTVNPNKTSYFGRYIGWKTDMRRCKSGHLVHGVCIFGVEDLQTIRSRLELIANKFDITYDPIAYNCMEEWLYSKIQDGENILQKNIRLYRKIAGVGLN